MYIYINTQNLYKSEYTHVMRNQLVVSAITSGRKAAHRYESGARQHVQSRPRLQMHQ